MLLEKSMTSTISHNGIEYLLPKNAFDIKLETTKYTCMERLEDIGYQIIRGFLWMLR